MAEEKADAQRNFSVELDLSARSLKVQGTREFIDEQFARFEKMLAAKPKTRAARTKTRPVKAKKRRGRPRAQKPKRKTIEPLDLKGGEGIAPLKEYVKGAKVRSNYERCALYLYYLQRVLGRKTVLHADVGECFRHLGVKVPANLQVCLSEAKRKYKYVDMPGNGTVKLTPTGVNLVEKKLFAE